MSETTDFEQAVWQMRLRQKEYFQRPIQGRLIAAKHAERAVDEILEMQRGVQPLKSPDEIPPDEIPY